MKSSAFVDHSLLIKSVVNAAKRDVSLITCPRRFGKSSNMDMLKKFLRIEVDEDGNKKDYKKTNNYTIFTSSSYYKKTVNIANDPEFMTEHLAQYPVIFVNFFNPKVATHTNIIKNIKFSISRAYEEHKYILKYYKNIVSNVGSSEDEKDKAGEIIKEFNKFFKNKGKDADLYDVSDSLRYLSKILNDHFKQNVYVLVDEYDAPLQNAIQNENEKGVKTIVEFMDGILCSVFKNNECLEKGFLTGVSGIVRASGSSGFNNVTEHKFLEDGVYSEFYGFSEDQVLELMKQFKKNEYEISQLKGWYDGYLTRIKHLAVYCPWSVINYLKTDIFMSYWAKSGFVVNMEKLIQVGRIKENVQKLLSGQDISLYSFENAIDSNKIQGLNKLINCKSEASQTYIDLFFSYLFESGYLTCTKMPNSYRIPNEEIKTMFIKFLIDYYYEVNVIKREDTDRVVKELNKQLEDSNYDNVSELEKALATLFSCLSLIDVRTSNEDGVHRNESIFHTLVTRIAIDTCANQVGTELYLAGLRPDIVIINYKAELAIVIEMKSDYSADQALNQNLQYIEHIFTMKSANEKIKTIKSMGINVSLDTKVDVKIEKYNYLQYKEQLEKKKKLVFIFCYQNYPD
jgi:hypothetical protein